MMEKEEEESSEIRWRNGRNNQTVEEKNKNK